MSNSSADRAIAVATAALTSVSALAGTTKLRSSGNWLDAGQWDRGAPSSKHTGFGGKKGSRGRTTPHISGGAFNTGILGMDARGSHTLLLGDLPECGIEKGLRAPAARKLLHM